jgi:hypothetical protein
MNYAFARSSQAEVLHLNAQAAYQVVSDPDAQRFAFVDPLSRLIRTQEADNLAIDPPWRFQVKPMCGALDCNK